MKSIVRNFALSAAAAVSTANQRTFRFKKGHLLLALGLVAPLQSFAASEAPYYYRIFMSAEPAPLL